jgi:alkylation response protein AidB-like acyl-CoA dehydrogenase
MLPQYAAAAALEAHLGDPREAKAKLSFARSIALDEREAFPQESVDALIAWGYLRQMVPVADGGRLGSFEEAIWLQRCVSRRDLTSAIALGQSFLGTVAVWLAGTPLQRARTAEALLAGRLASLALTEEEHGSDVLASSMTAFREAGGFRVRGRKWLINNATRGTLLTLFARTAPEGGLHGCSLLLLDKERIDGAALHPLPKLPTHGIRGADISGIAIDGALLPEGALLGPEHAGAEVLLQGLQLTRTACAGFSLGAADTALRLALDFAKGRRLYGQTVFDLPHARAQLAGCFADLLLCDALATVGARAIQAAPEQLSLWSSVVKYFVPVSCERVIREAAVVLGARHYLRDHAGGAFQKLLRDAAVVSLFDGSTAVNLDAIGAQLPRLGPARAAPPEERAQTLALLCTLTAPLPPLAPSRLALANAGRDDLTQGLAETVALLRGPGAALPEALTPLADRLVRALEALSAEVAALASKDRAAMKRSPELFSLAARFASLSAGAAALHLFVRARGQLDAAFDDGAWLVVCLARVLGEPVPAVHLGALAERMTSLHAEERAFAHNALPLGRGAP